MYKIPIKRLILAKVITIVIIPFAFLWTLLASFNILYTRAPVNGQSMYPTLNKHLSTTNKQDVVYISNFASVHKNDIIVMDLRDHPDFGNFTIKRLIATAGDIVSISIEDEFYALRVNNKLIYSRDFDNGRNTYFSLDSYIKSHLADTSRIVLLDDGNYGVKINQGEVFVLGDNWNVSRDSSIVGPINEKTIVGKVSFIIQSNQNELVSLLQQIF